jgi:UDP-N-acetylmuramoylalanine--D-glutamate ligase
MKKLVVLGGGESGVGAALLGKAKGWDVFVSDYGNIADKYKEVLLKNSIPFEETQHTWANLKGANVVVKSPGIPDTAEVVMLLWKQNIPVISEIEWAATFTKAKLIGITGSNGKTTTTSLVYHLLKSAGLNVGVAGNIGDSFAKQVIDDKYDYYVLEISSFQLDGVYETKFDIAVLLNITPDHLDRYNYNFKEYVASKFRIAKRSDQNSVFIYGAENEAIAERLKVKEVRSRNHAFGLTNTGDFSAFVNEDKLIAKVGGTSVEVLIADLPIKGKHNISNVLATLLVTCAVGIPQEKVIAGLKTFKGIEHRLEFVAIENGVEFINDSKATNVDAVWYALDAMEKPVVWIAGGVDKGNDYNELLPLVKDKVVGLVCLGVANTKLIEFFSPYLDTIVEAKSAEEAVEKAREIANDGNVVLLSPACASFDLFKNYEDRGKKFKQAINNITHKI